MTGLCKYAEDGHYCPHSGPGPCPCNATGQETSVTGHTEMEAQLRGALVKAVEVIRQWHGMGVPKKQEHELWTLYWRSAPEMKQIREALSDEQQVTGEEQ